MHTGETDFFLVVRFLLGNSPASELYMPTFRNTLSIPSSWANRYEDGTVFRNVGIKNSDAGKLPRRKHTTFRTWRKFENKIYFFSFLQNVNTGCGAQSASFSMGTGVVSRDKGAEE